MLNAEGAGKGGLSRVPSTSTFFSTRARKEYHLSIVTSHAQRERGKVIGIYIYIFICLWILNRTLAIDSPLQTFAVGFRVKFMD